MGPAVRTLFAPEGPALSDQDFTRSALDQPLSGWKTFGYGARSALEETLLGTAVREGRAPDPAFRIDPRQTPSRAPPRFIAETAAEVEERGDKLFATKDDYQASSYFREAVPFEPGMTENRAKALSEMHDLRLIRDHYTSKRPVTAFLGGVAGAALAPENYIPVLGEVAAAATTARLGRIAGRALVSSGDAAINTAAFQLLTASERARLGDDVSWQAIGENVAFAALAGAAIGGALGGLTSLRGRYSPPIREAPSLQGAESPALVPEAAPGRITGLNMPGTATARFADVNRMATGDTLDGVPFGQLLDRIETPAMRARASAVMNDAVAGLVIDGEVRLGAQARLHLADIQTAIERAKVSHAWDRVGGNPTGLRNDPLVAITPKDIKGLLVERGAFKSINELEFSKRGYGLVKVIWNRGPHSSKELKLQVSREDVAALPYVVRDFEPSSVSADGLRREWRVKLPSKAFGPRTVVFADTVMGDGKRHLVTTYVPAGDDAKLPLSKTRKPAAPSSTPQAGNLVGDIATGPFDRTPEGRALPAEGNIAPGGLAAKASARFTVPAPEPMLPQLTAAYKSVDALPRPAASGLDPRLAESARAEGLDIEAGTHDLEDDIAILRERGALSAEDETALQAADETLQSASAWGDVTASLIICKATGQ